VVRESVGTIATRGFSVNHRGPFRGLSRPIAAHRGPSRAVASPPQLAARPP
jgi:hypothetical protein